MDPQLLILLIETLLGGAGQILAAQKNKTAQAVGTDIQLANTVVLGILQKNAEIQGLTIDWKDPAAVANYVQSLAVFVPIPESPPSTISA